MAVKHKRTTTTGYSWTSSDLVDGQLGLNTTDGTLHFKKADTSIATLRAIPQITEDGNDFNITGLVDTGTGGDGQDINITAGASTADTGGDLVLRAGAGTTSVGGSVTIEAGEGASSVYGNVSIGGQNVDITALTALKINGSAGTSGQVLTSAGASSPATWSAVVAPAGTLTGSTLAAGVTASSLTSVGTLTSGTWNASAVGAVYGGTAQTSWATGDLLYASGTNTLSKRSIGSTGDVLTVSGGVPTWAAPAAGGSVYWKDPVRVATTANGTLSSAYANGQTVDGVTLATGDRILLKNQSSAAENGIYVVAASGSPTRSTDADADAELQRGTSVYVQFGTVNGGQVYQLMASDQTPIVIGTSTQVWITQSGLIVRGANTASSIPTASATNAVSIGASATVSGTSGVAIGNTAQVSASEAVSVGASTNNQGSATRSVSLGYACNNQASNSIAIGQSCYNGSGNTGAVAIGWGAWTDFPGEINITNAGFSAQGDVHTSLIPLYMQTSNATPTELKTGSASYSTAPSGVIALTNNSTYLFDVDIVARKSTTGTDYAAWNLKFCINREANAASTALIGAVIKTVVGMTSGAASGGWDVSCAANTTNGRPNISVTGQTATTIRWVANARMTKVSG